MDKTKFVLTILESAFIVCLVIFYLMWREPDARLTSELRAGHNETLELGFSIADIRRELGDKNWEFVHCTPTNKDCGRLDD